MQKIHPKVIQLTCFVNCALFLLSPAALGGIPKVTVTYPPLSDKILNPERGFHGDIDLMSDSDFSWVRTKGYTIARAYVRLDDFRDRPISAAFLQKLDRQLDLLQPAGIKVVLRFSYNFPTGSFDKAPDAPLSLVLQHIGQLKPILAAHADVITVLQAGFIGAWGEWHSSANGLDSRGNRAKILNALLAAVPRNRMVQVRTPGYMRDLFPQPLALANAFTPTYQARTAHHNDCFLSNQDDAGTYVPIQQMKAYLDKASPFIAIGGETCQVTPDQHRSDCPTAQAELAQFHWSYLNDDFYRGDLDRWKREGCYTTITNRLGYRFELIRSNFPTQISAGGSLSGDFVVRNVGYASPYNLRGLELILQHRQTRKQIRLPILQPLSATQDPRFWFPEAGQITVKVSGNIPASAEPGPYNLFLNLPDPMPNLKSLPAYSIRLANQGVWQPSTGFNSLRRSLTISQ